MEFDKEIFKEALKENKIVSWKNIFRNVVRSYLRLAEVKSKL